MWRLDDSVGGDCAVRARCESGLCSAALLRSVHSRRRERAAVWMQLTRGVRSAAVHRRLLSSAQLSSAHCCRRRRTLPPYTYCHTQRGTAYIQHATYCTSIQHTYQPAATHTAATHTTQNTPPTLPAAHRLTAHCPLTHSCTHSHSLGCHCHPLLTRSCCCMPAPVLLAVMSRAV